MTDTVQYSLAMFSPHVGSKFQCQPELGKACRLELVEATSRGGDPNASGKECFSLVFHDPEASADSYLPQAMYALEHDALGTLHIFIVPIGPDPDRQGMRYEAVFA